MPTTACYTLCVPMPTHAYYHCRVAPPKGSSPPYPLQPRLAGLECYNGVLQLSRPSLKTSALAGLSLSL